MQEPVGDISHPNLYKDPVGSALGPDKVNEPNPKGKMKEG